MQQLSGLDNSFLSMESRTFYGHVSSLAIFNPDGKPFSLDDLKRLVMERIHLVPPFRRRLVDVPFGLDHPYWIDDPDFDIDFHIRHIAVPPPGDEHQLAELSARIAARHLDRSRPLWEMYLIEGLEGGYVAELTKIHHAAIDGVSGAEILGVLLDIEEHPPPVPPPDPPWQPDQQPSSLVMLGRGATGVLSRPRVGLRVMRKALRNGPALARNFGVRIAPPRPPRLLSRPDSPTPEVPFSRPISAHRHFAFGSLPLAEVKAVKQSLGGTVNDVVMAMCTGALRRWLIDHDSLPAEPIHAMVPISVRTPEQVGTFGNRVSAMVTELPTDEADPVIRYRRMHEAMSVAKEQHGAIPADILQDFAQFTPPSVLGLASRVIARTQGRVKPPFNVVISNVPGPQFPLYSSGAVLKGIYPLSAIADGVGVNMTLMSYNGNLDFGVLADREIVPDVWEMIAGLGDELETLVKAAQALQ
jgi:WS/DGAT/MGAT family acyltransferase